MRLRKNLTLLNLRPTIATIATIVVVVAAVELATSEAFAQDQAQAQPLLTIGSEAPPLDIELWFSDREGEFEHTSDFEPGKIYLIDFWATWSTQSHQWMAKYADLQDRHFDDNLQIISITDEDEDSVADFLELDVNDNSGMIYAEQSLGYCLTSDPDRSVYEDYIEASQQTRIPTVFIVGKTGLIEWFGSPQKMMRPLKRVIKEKWDREQYKKDFLAHQQRQQLAMQVRKLMEAGDNDGALEAIEKMMQDAPNSENLAEMAQVRLAILMQSDSPKLSAAFSDVVKGEDLGSYRLNELAWSIVTRAQSGKKVDAELLATAAETANRAVNIARGEDDDDHLGAILDTEAHLVFLQGDLDRAIELQTEASEVSQRSDIQEYLNELLHEKEKKQDSATEGDTKPTTGDADVEKVPDDQVPADELPAEPVGVES